MEIEARTIALLLTAARRETLADALCAAGWHVTDELSDSVVVIVAEHEVTPVVSPAVALTDIGQILWGVEPPTESSAHVVYLPHDASSAEIVRTANLLAEVIRLRRQLRTVHDTQSMWRDQATRDPLTGLFNRRGWDLQLAYRRETPLGRQRPAALAIVDVDQFKPLNDTQGHSIGDDTLRQIAEALRTGVRPDDVVARLGGDEFGIYLAGIEPAHVAIVLDRLQRRATGRATVSIGGVTIPSEAQHPWSHWLALADSALIDAKRLGRNRIVVRGGEKRKAES